MYFRPIFCQYHGGVDRSVDQRPTTERHELGESCRMRTKQGPVLSAHWAGVQTLWGAGHRRMDGKADDDSGVGLVGGSRFQMHVSG